MEKSSEGMEAVDGTILSVHETSKSAKDAMKVECPSVNNIGSTPILNEKRIRKSNKKFESSVDSSDEQSLEEVPKKKKKVKKLNPLVKGNQQENKDPKKVNLYSSSNTIIQKLKKFNEDMIKIDTQLFQSDESTPQDDAECLQLPVILKSIEFSQNPPRQESYQQSLQCHKEKRSVTNEKEIDKSKTQAENCCKQNVGIDRCNGVEGKDKMKENNKSLNSLKCVTKNDSSHTPTNKPNQNINMKKSSLSEDKSKKTNLNIIENQNITPKDTLLSEQLGKNLNRSPKSIPGGAEYSQIIRHNASSNARSLFRSGEVFREAMNICSETDPEKSFLGELNDLESSPVDFQRPNPDQNRIKELETQMKHMQNQLKNVTGTLDRVQYYVHQLLQDLERRSEKNQQSKAPTEEDEVEDMSLEDLKKAAKQSTLGDSVRKVALMLFGESVLLQSSLRGRRTCPQSGDRPALDPKKLRALINIVMEVNSNIEGISEKKITGKLGEYLKNLRSKKKIQEKEKV